MHGGDLTHEKIDAELEKAERKAALRLYRIQNFVWLAFGFAATIACLTFMFDETTRMQTSLSTKLSVTYQYIWNISWGIGGVFIMYGVYWWRSRAEVIGHIFFGGALAVNAITIYVTVRHFIPTLATLLAFTVASFYRGYYIFKYLPRRDVSS